MVHVVAQGEHLAGIAHRYGFGDYARIWDDPENAALKAKRQNPNVLFPGDRLFIPEREEKEAPVAENGRHRFRAKVKPLLLPLRLEQGYGRPMAHTKCRLLVAGEVVELTTDADGAFTHPIPKEAEDAVLVVFERATAGGREVPLEVRVPMRIGHLDPVEEPPGQAARLANLGYYRASLDQVDERELRSAVEEFQCEHDLTVDGVCGPKTQAKLREAHGC